MSQVTVLAEGQITPSDAIIVELVEADETPAVIIVRWPAKPTVFHPRPFPCWRRHCRSHLRECRGRARATPTGATTVSEVAARRDEGDRLLRVEQCRDRASGASAHAVIAKVLAPYAARRC